MNNKLLKILDQQRGQDKGPSLLLLLNIILERKPKTDLCPTPSFCYFFTPEYFTLRNQAGIKASKVMAIDHMKAVL